jgi:hypothetical protein
LESIQVEIFLTNEGEQVHDEQFHILEAVPFLRMGILECKKPSLMRSLIPQAQPCHSTFLPPAADI